MQKNGILILLGVLIFTSFSIPFTSKSLELNNENDSSQIGKLLFFEKRLSKNGMKSCASCHAPEFAYTDGYRRTMNIEAELLTYNTPSILNLSNYYSLNWASPSIRYINQQVIGPLFKRHPIELGMDSNNMEVLRMLSSDSNYKKYLHQLNIKVLTWNNVVNFLGSYVSKLNSRESKYDRYLKGEVNLDKNEMAGKKLFFSSKLNCSACHNGTDFNEPSKVESKLYFANIGYMDKDLGLFTVTGDSQDIGKFRIPSLRNVTITGPYFHDGGVTNLKDAISFLSKGGLHLSKSKSKVDNRLKPFEISNEEIKQLICFLNTLTDTSYLSNSFFTHLSQ